MNQNDFLTGLTGAVAVVPIVIALVQCFKMIGLPNKFAPLVSIGVGVLVAFLLKHDMADLTHTILEGVLYGLSASGLYSGIQTTMFATNGQGAGQGAGQMGTPTTTSGETVTKTATVTETKKELK